LVAEARRKVAEARAARAAKAARQQQERDQLRKEQQRLRKVEETREALRGAMALLEETAGARGVDALEEAMRAAAKHVARSEPLVELVAQARTLIEQARAAEAAAEAAAAAERLRLEEEAAALALRMQNDALRMQSDALRLQQVQAQLGVPLAAPAAPAPHPDDEEDQCVLCFDAPKDHIIIPCGHMCVCEACAKQLTQMKNPSCPICRTAIQQTTKVFHA
jgi:hypothetical protein